MLVVVTGGSGSGKSVYAEKLLARLADTQEGQKIYIATMKPFGSEGQERISRHRVQRQAYGFLTVEQYTRIEEAQIPAGYISSRALSGLAAVLFQNANKKGSLAVFSGPAGKGFVCTVLILTFSAAGVLQLMLSIQIGVLLITSILCLFLYYYHMSKKNFGGITGDLAGWFLQCVELLILYIVVITAWVVKNL